MNPFKAKTIDRLQYFVGRVCSVFTSPTCRQFDELRSREHYVVLVEEIGSDGLWGKHPYRKTMSFFPIESIVFIQEEQELNPNDPEHREMIETYEKQTGKKILSDISPKIAPQIKKQEPQEEVPVTFVDADQLDRLIKQTKMSYVHHDLIKESIDQKTNVSPLNNLSQIQL